MPKFNLDVHFGVYCAKCGKPMCSNCNTDIPSKSGLKMTVEPCQNCLDKEFSRGKKEKAP
jgi:RNase P subunit RPR2